MRVDFNQNHKQNPYFGIINVTEAAKTLYKERNIPLSAISKIQQMDQTNPINVTIDRLIDRFDWNESERCLEKVYDDLLVATIKDGVNEITQIENPFKTVFLDNNYFIKKVFKQSQKMFYTGSNK